MRDNWGLLLLIGIGAFLRLWQLGRASYQIDELATMQMWQQDQTVGDIFDHALRDLHWNHRMVVVPLINMWVMQHGSYGTALPPEWMSRLPHAIMGIFTIPLFWLLGRSLGGRASAWWSGLLCTRGVRLQLADFFLGRSLVDGH